MLKIRKNIFETNSSSTHSLVISKKDRGYDYNLPVDEEGVLTISFGEFGWGPEILKYPHEKLSYLITDRNSIHYDWQNPPSEKEFEYMLSQDKRVQEIIEVVKSCCPEVKEVKYEFGDNKYNPLGYVDHQSQGTSYESDLSIEDIIFSNKVIIMIDNDNSYHYESYFESWDGEPAEDDIENLFRKENKNDSN